MKLSQKTKDNIAYCAMTVLTLYFITDLLLLFGRFPSSLIAPQRQLELVTFFGPPSANIELYRSFLLRNATLGLMILGVMIFRDYRKK